jgi:hypothetical protein
MAIEEKEVISVRTGLYGENERKMLEDVQWFIPKPFAAILRACAQKGLQGN